MTTLNIMPFPRSLNNNGEPTEAHPGAANSLTSSATTATAIASAIATPAGRATSDEKVEFAQIVIRTAIRFGKRNGQSLTSLSPQMRKWLLDLCEQGDPTAQVVLNWLNGNRRFLSESLATADGEGA